VAYLRAACMARPSVAASRAGRKSAPCSGEGEGEGEECKAVWGEGGSEGGRESGRESAPGQASEAAMVRASSAAP